MSVEIDTVLVPVDGSDQSVSALEYAVAVAERYGASVHALYVLEEGLVRGMETGDVEEETVAAEHQALVDSAGDLAGDVTVSHSTAAGFSPSRLRQHPGSVILDAAEELDADFIVVPRETPTADPAEVLGKSAQYVLEYASQPVLSV
ncbi:universal stress protein [Haloarculaceae archaeon H-GB2-1]|nr:universal stress protein [Haloarculaceae archaeon H-GB1-1]MEA5385797.1 universal stress protein [Haloarculaceae archaeon H-GB11]MEA5407297.1 universal stress protein [Haloarculaceae archaeon H-GB2-1]